MTAALRPAGKDDLAPPTLGMPVPRTMTIDPPGAAKYSGIGYAGLMVREGAQVLEAGVIAIPPIRDIHDWPAIVAAIDDILDFGVGLYNRWVSEDIGKMPVGIEGVNLPATWSDPKLIGKAIRGKKYDEPDPLHILVTDRLAWASRAVFPGAVMLKPGDLGPVTTTDEATARRYYPEVLWSPKNWPAEWRCDRKSDNRRGALRDARACFALAPRVHGLDRKSRQRRAA